MRFRVEITPLAGETSGTDNFAVADHWQSALRDVRELRGEAGGEDALSVEALGEDAHRVIDVERRLRYLVEPAPESGSQESSRLVMGARDVQPTEAVPLAYRERAVRLVGPASRERTRHVLESLLDELLADASQRPFGQVIELAAFASDAVDMSSPLATLSYRDWREDVTWWFSEGLPHASPQTEPAPKDELPAQKAAQENGAGVRPSSAPPARPLLESTRPAPVDEALPSSRRAQEELITELFDVMHELDYARDLPSGVRFVLDVVAKVLPGRVSAVHVFDIDARRFVLVGGRGLPRGVLGATLPESDPFFHALLLRKRARRVEGDALGSNELRGHFAPSPPKRLMASPMLHRGRDLGVIEVGDPEGPEPYSDHEAAALDYIASRLAEFLARRPIVLDAELFDDARSP